MSLMELLTRWPQISIQEMGRIINHQGRREPLLRPYEREFPVSHVIQKNLFLAPMERGRLTLIDKYDVIQLVCDCTGQQIASTFDLEHDENGFLLEERLYFLKRDVLRVEKDHPEYLREIVVPEDPVHETALQEAQYVPVPVAMQTVTKVPEPVVMPSPVPVSPPPEDVMLKDVQVAEILNVSRKTIWDWVKEKRLPAPVIYPRHSQRLEL